MNDLGKYKQFYVMNKLIFFIIIVLLNILTKKYLSM